MVEIKNFSPHTDSDIQLMRALIERLGDQSSVVDFEEMMLLPAVRAMTRVWQAGDKAAAFAFVDDYNNLNFDIDPEFSSTQIETGVMDWGTACVKQRNTETGEENTLDASCRASHTGRITLLEKYGFRCESLRSLGYARLLDTPIPDHPLPDGFSVRPVRGEAEVESLVALHRSAFETENMTVERRLAILHAPQYDPALDLVAAAPNGELCAFCICGFTDDSHEVGTTDPIGTHARYKRLGLGKAVVTAGLRLLKERGAKKAELGTSSENLAMQRLAEALGFTVTSERLWFSKAVQ